ncbi:YheU family protein [Aestuariibacter sp. A3R04]|uniref:YheU family protein n=1 Tax=Aestuariibacter sp. A3R04 TaxID=2841571 RepID=UPI001C0A5595|nr:YheU family protein [Aestuariibacter sp. A3R04]MBU3020337.1 YheU family protein [Aestuariibacter sp. A3R04]
MIIPIHTLETDTLRNVAESFVLREGTDYGEVEVSFDDKVKEVMASLRSGETVLVYSELHDSVNIHRKDDYEQGEAFSAEGE